MRRVYLKNLTYPITEDEWVETAKECEEFMNDNKDKCSDCPFNDTSCPGGMWCTDIDY